VRRRDEILGGRGSHFEVLEETPLAARTAYNARVDRLDRDLNCARAVQLSGVLERSVQYTGGGERGRSSERPQVFGGKNNEEPRPLPLSTRRIFRVAHGQYRNLAMVLTDNSDQAVRGVNCSNNSKYSEFMGFSQRSRVA
jgi:hypothetical protein